MRRKAENRLEEIAAAAIACFTEAGIRRTQMADVAKVAGVSAGTLYLYVTGKEALFHLAILRLSNHPIETLPLPLADPGMKATVAALAARAEEVAVLPALRAALEPKAAPDRGVLRAIGTELYDMLHEIRRAVWLINRCSPEVPELDAFQADIMRGRYRDDLAQVALKLAGRKAPLEPRLRLAARIATETIAWTAMHRMRETAANTIEGLSEADAREVATRAFADTLLTAASAQD